MVKRPKTGQQICKTCFFLVFETEVHETIVGGELFKGGDRVAIGASGGKGACTKSLDGGEILKVFGGRFDGVGVCDEDFK